MYLGQQVLLLEKKNGLVSISYAAGLIANIGEIFLPIPALVAFWGHHQYTDSVSTHNYHTGTPFFHRCATCRARWRPW